MSATQTPSYANWVGTDGAAGDCKGALITDNKTISSGYVDASTALRDALKYVRTTLVQDSSTNNTDLDTINVATAVTGTTDIIARDRYYDSWCELAVGAQWTTNGATGLRALTNCDDKNSVNRCEQATIRISAYALGSGSATKDRWLMCHEYGHAIGLDHMSTTPNCMRGYGDYHTPAYTNHDRAHFRSNWSTEPNDRNQYG